MQWPKAARLGPTIPAARTTARSPAEDALSLLEARFDPKVIEIGVIEKHLTPFDNIYNSVIKRIPSSAAVFSALDNFKFESFRPRGNANTQIAQSAIFNAVNPAVNGYRYTLTPCILNDRRVGDILYLPLDI